MKSIIITIFTLLNTILYSQEIKRTIHITRAYSFININGVLDDEAWTKASIAGDFTQNKPYNGAPPTEQTEVRICYDDIAIYIGATLYDSSPDSIFTTLSKRDGGFGIDADMFEVALGTFNDGINTNTFLVTAAGVQSDIKGSSNNNDINWDAVWESAISINDNGWVVEIKIPYSALRFSKKDEQVWGVNFSRGLLRKKEWSSWNMINNKIQGYANQAGILTGIKGIEPPLRLSFTPYLSSYTEHKSEDNSWNIGAKGGMDLKYGINESFTLDMMLIPDFSQVQTDDQVLNLSAFEIRYQERRPFFTEGTELFEKGDIFYSKRIGSFPKKGWDIYDDVNSNEEVTLNPGETKIINGTKVTGRTSKGLGIGIFNAVTLKAVAEITDTITGAEREYITQPLTNYNILVFDQNLKNNSFVSVINTNMVMPDFSYTSNVTATEFLLKNKNQSYEASGVVGISQVYDYNRTYEYGYKHKLKFAKTGGSINYSLGQELVDDKYNQNDMGFLRFNNYMSTKADVSYKILQPYKNLINWRIRFDSEYQNQYNSLNFVKWQVGMNLSAEFKNRWYWGLFIDGTPYGEHDYYEAREEGKVYKRASGLWGGSFFGTDTRKELSFNVFAMYWGSSSIYNERNSFFSVTPTWRANDKLRFSLKVKTDIIANDVGYVDSSADTIYFGRRDRNTITNTFVTDVAFNNKMSLSLRARHYISSAAYKQFYTLNSDGTLLDNNTYSKNSDINYNAFNIDLVYTWRFAPGSDIVLVWKNAIYEEGDKILDNYWSNLGNTITASQTNFLSIKILYYLDYLYLVRDK